jgi:hypothetical protein
MTTTVTAHYNGSAFVPDEPVQMPKGSKVTVLIDAPLAQGRQAGQESQTGLARLAAMAKALPPDPDAPADGAAQHDHYLYGTTKR